MQRHEDGQASQSKSPHIHIMKISLDPHRPIYSRDYQGNEDAVIIGTIDETVSNHRHQDPEGGAFHRDVDERHKGPLDLDDGPEDEFGNGETIEDDEEGEEGGQHAVAQDRYAVEDQCH